MHFGNYGFQKTLLDKCLKSRISEDPSTINMVNRMKQCCNLNDTTFTRFVDPYEGK